MGIFNEQNFDHPFAKGIQGAPGVGFSLTADGNYDMNKKRLTNVGAPSANTDAATKKYVDDNSGGSPTTTRLTVDSNIDMKDRFRILNLKHPVDSDEPATKQYSDSRFLDRNGSRTMIGNLSMNNNKIIKVGTPTVNDDAATKKYVDDKSSESVPTSRLTVDSNINMGDQYRITNLSTPLDGKEPPTKDYVDNTFLDRDGSYPMKGNINMANNRIFNLPNPTGSQQPTPLAFTDLKYVARDGSSTMTNNLNMDNKRIINLRPPTSDTDAATKKYVDDNTGAPDLSDYLEKDGTVAMTGNLNLNNHEIDNLSDPTTDKQAANRGWVRKQIERLDHHSGEAQIGVFNINPPAAPTTMYLQYISRGSSSSADFVFTTSAPSQPLVGWTPTANTYINKIEFQFGSRNVNVDFLFFIPRDDSHSNSVFWVSGNRTGTWSLNIHKSWNYNMSGVKLRTHNNNNHSAITCRVFFDLPKAITKPLGRIEINTPDIVISGVLKDDVNLGGNKIENLGAPTQGNEAATKSYVDNLVQHATVQPSHYKDEFAYLMTSASQWTDEIDNRTSFVIKSIGDLGPKNGNFHDYNLKVIKMGINKYSQGGYKYKMGINFYRLNANTDYTLCLEILNSEYALWHKSQISVDKGTSTGLTIGNVSIRKLSHRFIQENGSPEFMYYHRIIVNFRKLAVGNRFFLHFLVNIPQDGTDLAIYPNQFTGVYIIAYGIVGTFSNIDPDKVYDFHTAYDIKPTEVTYNVDINANQHSIKGIKLDPNDKSSAATIGQIEAMTKYTIKILYKDIFEEIYDFTNAANYKLSSTASGIVFNYLSSSSGNTLRDIRIPDKTIDNIKKEGLNVNSYFITFFPPDGITKYTLCIVFYHWRNRIFYLTKNDTNSGNILLKLDYNSSNNKVSLNVNKLKSSLTIPNDFNGKKIVIWLTENFDANITKVKISNYSAILSLQSVRYTNLQRFTFNTEDGVISKICFLQTFTTPTLINIIKFCFKKS